jgi:hypothetical protein
MVNSYCYHDASLPNVLIVEDDELDKEAWERLDSKRDDVDLVCDNSPNTILIQWLQLFAQDHIPRALVCDWHIAIDTMGVLKVVSEDGVHYTAEGAAYVIMMAMQAVGDQAGMFVAYTSDVEGVKEDTKYWDAAYKKRLHIIDKSTVRHDQLLDFIVEHTDYAEQDTGLCDTGFFSDEVEGEVE